MKSIQQLTPQELRAIAALKDQIDQLLNDNSKPLEPVRVYRRKHWTQTPRGREIMRKEMIRRHREGRI